MEQFEEFLLHLYRAARECEPDRFRNVALGLLKRICDFSAAFWGEGRFSQATSRVVPATMHTQNLGREFLVGWSRAKEVNPVVPAIVSSLGSAVQVHVPTYYRQMPVFSNLAQENEIRSMTVIAISGLEVDAIEWLSLFTSNDHPRLEQELRWLETCMPHLAEALRINQALYLADDTAGLIGDRHIGVAESQSGCLLRADPGLLQALSVEWGGFDGRSVPAKLVQEWRRKPAFSYFTKRYRIDLRRGDTLVYLFGRNRSPHELLTQRQVEIASLYARGLSNKEIAKACGIAPATVRNQLASIYATLEVHDRVEMADRLGRMLGSATLRRRTGNFVPAP